MVALAPYPRGFVIYRTDSNPALPEGWARVDLPASGWSFGHDQYYSPEIVHVPNQDQWVLVHGLCLHANPNSQGLDPARHLAEQLGLGIDQFLDALDYLGGRHLILRGDAEEFDVFQDAAGMRSVYFSPQAELVASHLNLVNRIHEHPLRTEPEGSRALTHSWDATRYVGIGPLLPNHYLSSQTWGVHRFFPRRENPYSSWSLEERLAEFKRLWQVQMESLVATGSQLVMSITGGADSRTSLALSTNWINDLDFFTYTARKDPAAKGRTTLALDVTIVEQIKSLVPLRHEYFKFEEQNKDVMAKLDPLLDQNTPQKHSRWLVAHYVEAFPGEDVIHLRGNGYEIGRAHWGLTDSNSKETSLRNLYLQLTKANSGYVSPADRDKDFHRGFKKWSYDGKTHGYHLRDIFYWEIRSGRWLSEILNETDLAFETHVPLNVRAMLDITLSLPLEDRRAGTFFADLINSTYPVLNFPGKNTEQNLYEQFRESFSGAKEADARKVAEKLSDDLQVVTANGESTALNRASNELYLPKQYFEEGAVASRTFNPVERKGSLSFAVLSPYENQSALGRFEYQIVIDGQVELSWDGACIGRPVHVTIDGMTPENEVRLSVSALGHQVNKESWQQATHATIEDLKFTKTPRPTLTVCRVSSDLPIDHRKDANRES